MILKIVKPTKEQERAITGSITDWFKPLQGIGTNGIHNPRCDPFDGKKKHLRAPAQSTIRSHEMDPSQHLFLGEVCWLDAVT